MRCDWLRERLAQLLEEAAASRADQAEEKALRQAAHRVWYWGPLDAVVRELPQLRCAKGLVMAIGWAAEYEEAKDEAWKAQALVEHQRAVAYYRKTLPTGHGVTINGKEVDITP